MGFTAHKNPVECITSVTQTGLKKNESLIASGSNDEVIIWNQKLSPGSSDHRKFLIEH